MTDAAQTQGPAKEPVRDAPATGAKRGSRGPLTYLLVAVPLLAFAGIAVLCYQRLGVDASAIPSALIGKASPPFELPVIDTGSTGSQPAAKFTTADLKTGGVSVVNFFASYCDPCKRENPLLMQISQDKALAARGVRLIGIAWEDKIPGATRRFLENDGNPFSIVGEDVSGRTGIDWGITGIPETFIVKGDGTIAYKYVGELTEDVMTNLLMPQVEKAGAR